MDCRTPSSFSARMRESSAMQRRTMLPGGITLIEMLCREIVTAVKVGDSVWDEKVISDEAFELTGPSIQDVVAHLELRNPANSFACRVCIQYKYLDGDWSTIGSSDVILAEQNTADCFVSTPFTDRSRLGRIRIRVVLQYHAKTGGSAGAAGQVSVSLAARPFCC